MSKITFPILSGVIADYSFGYSATDDVNTVANWQEANNVFEEIPFGTHYVFAKPKCGCQDLVLRKVFVFRDINCQLAASGFKNITPICRMAASGFKKITADAIYEFTAITSYNLADAQVACEILGNPHTGVAEALARAQHHYAIVAEAKMAGTVFTEAGRVSKDAGATWSDLSTLGFDSLGRRLAGYKLPYTAPVNPLLRTSDACSSYSDSRLTEYFTDDMEYRTALPAVGTPPAGNFDLAGIHIASHLDERQATQGPGSVYVIWLAGHGQNYKLRINEETWLSPTEKNYIPSIDQVPVLQKNIPVAEFQIQKNYPKDFILDITKDGGASYDRYVVRRWSTGGHYAVACTITRTRDNKVYVCHTIGDMDVPSYIRIGPTTYNNMAAFKSCYDLGILTADADATFGFTDTATDWADLKLLIDDHS